MEDTISRVRSDLFQTAEEEEADLEGTGLREDGEKGSRVNLENSASRSQSSGDRDGNRGVEDRSRTFISEVRVPLALEPGLLLTQSSSLAATVLGEHCLVFCDLGGKSASVFFFWILILIVVERLYRCRWEPWSSRPLRIGRIGIGR